MCVARRVVGEDKPEEDTAQEIFVKVTENREGHVIPSNVMVSKYFTVNPFIKSIKLYLFVATFVNLFCHEISYI